MVKAKDGWFIQRVAGSYSGDTATDDDKIAWLGHDEFPGRMHVPSW